MRIHCKSQTVFVLTSSFQIEVLNCKMPSLGELGVLALLGGVVGLWGLWAGRGQVSLSASMQVYKYPSIPSMQVSEYPKYAKYASAGRVGRPLETLGWSGASNVYLNRN